MPWKGKLSIPDPVQHLDWIPAYAGMTDCRVNISDVSKTLSSRKLPKQLSGIQRTALALLNTTVEGQTSIPAPVQRLDWIPAYAGLTNCRVNTQMFQKHCHSGNCLSNYPGSSARHLRYRMALFSRHREVLGGGDLWSFKIASRNLSWAQSKDSQPQGDVIPEITSVIIRNLVMTSHSAPSSLSFPPKWRSLKPTKTCKLNTANVNFVPGMDATLAQATSNRIL